MTMTGKIQEALPFLREGPCVITPDQARRLYDATAYEKNRKVLSSSSHVMKLRRQMERGEWRPKDAIDLAVWPDGSMTLLNGHHRLIAQSESGESILWSVVLHNVETRADYEALYRTYDAVARKRSAANIAAASNLAEHHGLNMTTGTALLKAVVQIDTHFGSNMTVSRRAYTPQEIIDLSESWGAEALVFEDCLRIGTKVMKRRLMTGRIMGVALITLRINEAKACEFWTGIAADDGLHKGDARKTFLDFIRDHGQDRRNTNIEARGAAHAWNYWVDGNSFSTMRVPRAVKIKGSQMVIETT